MPDNFEEIGPTVSEIQMLTDGQTDRPTDGRKVTTIGHLAFWPVGLIKLPILEKIHAQMDKI